jgi:hypothetical protein
MKNSIDYNISVFFHRQLATTPILNKLIFYIGILPYQLIIYLGVLFAIFYMYLFQSFEIVQIVIFPFLFATTVNSYMEGIFFRRRPGCRFRKLSNTIDSSYCDDENAFHSMPCKQTLLFTALAVSVIYYLYDENVSDADKKFLYINMGKYRFLISSLFIFFIFMTSLERIVNGYNYFSDIMIGIVVGYIIGITSYFVCRSHSNVSFSDHLEWYSIRIIGCALCILMIARFLIKTIPSKFIIKTHIINNPRYNRKTARKKLI